MTEGINADVRPLTNCLTETARLHLPTGIPDVIFSGFTFCKNSLPTVRWAWGELRHSTKCFWRYPGKGNALQVAVALTEVVLFLCHQSGSVWRSESELRPRTDEDNRINHERRRFRQFVSISPIPISQDDYGLPSLDSSCVKESDVH